MENILNNILQTTNGPYKDYNKYKDNTYDIVSKVAYLIGVPKHIFENEFEPPKLSVYAKMNGDKNARIIRHLCIIRTAIELNFASISDVMKFEYRSILFMPEFVPAESISALSADGVDFYRKSATKLVHHIIDINRLISDRINNCSHLFPLWLKWDYLRELFIMPNGTDENGTKEAAELYYENKNLYPYKMYINWSPSANGNILYNDQKFITLLYQWNYDEFEDFSLLSDAGTHVKNSIYGFIDIAKKIVMTVDCENSDPYRLCATLRGLDPKYISKIQKIILLDDINTVQAWKILDNYVNIPIEHIMTERVKKSKSLVDIELTVRTCTEHFKNEVDSFIIASSDSDYWGLISSLPDANFLVMVEKEKCGADIKAAMESNGIFYCYMDDFYAGNSDDIKHKALTKEINRYLNDVIALNSMELLETGLNNTRISMNTAEKHRFIDKYIKNMVFSVDENGNISLQIKRK